MNNLGFYYNKIEKNYNLMKKYYLMSYKYTSYTKYIKYIYFNYKSFNYNIL